MAGWRLARDPNVRVSVICRSNYDTVKSKGFEMSSPKWGSGRFIPDSVHQSTRDIKQGPFDYVICANKITAHAAKDYESLKSVVDNKTTLVSLQNGLEVEAPLRRTFPENNLISGIIYYSCQQRSPGVVVHEASIRPYFSGLAPGTNPQGSSHDAQIQDLVRLGQGEFHALRNFWSERWIKQLWNGAFNPICAIYQQDTQKLLKNSLSGRSLIGRVMRETYNVATAAGALIDPDLPEGLIEMTSQSPPIEPSMLQDLRSKRAMEIETLCGKSHPGRLGCYSLNF